MTHKLFPVCSFGGLQKRFEIVRELTEFPRFRKPVSVTISWLRRDFQPKRDFPSRTCGIAQSSQQMSRMCAKDFATNALRTGSASLRIDLSSILRRRFMSHDGDIRSWFFI
jgi:hypothetical protein